MRAVIVAALAAVASAAPAITKTEVVNVYTTVWDDGSAPTPVAEEPKHNRWSWGNKPQPVASPVPVAAAPAYSAPAPAAPAPAAAAPAPASDWSAPASSGSTGGESTSGDYATAVVQHHNAHRANHSAPDLAWDSSLAATAQKIASSCVYAHDVTTNGGGYGQNIAAGCPSNNISSVITELFYNNEVNNFGSLYGQSTPSNINDESSFDGWGHFSQIVWKGTTKVGCATYDCSGQGLKNTGSSVPPYFTVCNYAPAGNFLGEFSQNVGKSLGKPSISWAST